MKGTRHSEEQIIAILKQGEAGLATTELCRQHGNTEETYYGWKAKDGTSSPLKPNFGLSGAVPQLDKVVPSLVRVSCRPPRLWVRWLFRDLPISSD
jgi:hypothetical protein